MKSLFFLCCCVLFFGYIHAQQTVQVSVRAYFDRLTGGTNLTSCRPAEDLSFGGPTQPTCGSFSYPVPPLAQGRWGRPASGSGKSGLGFTGQLNAPVNLNVPFFLGTLTHFNFPIYNAASSTYLNLIVTIRTQNGASLLFQGTFSYKMLIDETPNEPPCPYPGTKNCSDRVSFENAFDNNQRFTLGDVEYTLRIDGFRESIDSSSSPVTFFISNEDGTSVAYFFGSITAACPAICQNGGAYIVTPDNRCVCDCTGVTCPTGQVPADDCSCVCPNPNQCTNGGTLRPNCTCNCPACPAPKISSAVDCSCFCPPNYCNTGTLDTSNPNVCACNCPAGCPIANEVRNETCICNCPLVNNCPSPRIEDPNPNVCACICNNTCPIGYTRDQATCGCTCTKTCPNGVLNTTVCECGPCVGNWTKDPGTGLCTVCGLTQDFCSQTGERLDTTVCQCVCTGLNCRYDLGEVVDTNQRCGCRNCTRFDPCPCGNGIVEDGEDCDVNNTCCVNCRWTTNPCDDGNLCTTNDFCDGAGTCRGEYKCAPSTDCVTITCNSTNGVCQSVNAEEGSLCGPEPRNFCNARCGTDSVTSQFRCLTTPYSCVDPTPGDCYDYVCDPVTATCVDVPFVDSGCNDNDPCTVNDRCQEGVCIGDTRVCPGNSNPCQLPICRRAAGGCTFVNLNNVPCNADNNSCTQDDTCVGGICRAGRLVQCVIDDQCKQSVCNSSNGQCSIFILNGTACNDRNQCTKDDACDENGLCVGVTDETLLNTTACGYVPPFNPPDSNPTNLIVIFSLAGAAALIGAIVGLAFLVKKIRDSKLLDPDTWNPDTFSSVGANPLYQASSKVVDNRLYESN